MDAPGRRLVGAKGEYPLRPPYRLERGERLVLEVGAKDDPRSFFQHDDPRDRTRTGTNTIYTGGKFDTYLLLPIIPAR